MQYWLKAVIFFGTSLILLRIAGKRAISQMAAGEVVVMIALGELLIHPLENESPWVTAYGGALLILGLLIVSFLSIYIPQTKRWLLGEPIVLIEDGQINRRNLIRSRMTADELKMRLRIKEINDVSQVQFATLEISGELGVELYPEYAPATKQDINELKQALQSIGSQVGALPAFYASSPGSQENNLFEQAKQVQKQDPFH